MRLLLQPRVTEVGLSDVQRGYTADAELDLNELTRMT
jgi:hypothetical protein